VNLLKGKPQKDDYMDNNLNYNEEQRIEGIVSLMQIKSSKGMKDHIERMETDMRLNEVKTQSQLDHLNHIIN
jgi:hypothetical protein